ncbi:hypothetical protein TNCV_3779301 [Trichonephila clavipes]|nr:hypothetical protein TNCV_3779301 [Trichonephila clavipes]
MLLSDVVRSRSKRNLSWQGIGSPPVVGLEYHIGDRTKTLGEISQRNDRWRHHRSPPPQFRHGAEGEGNILQSPCTGDSAHKTFKPTDLTSTYFVCTRRASNPGLPVWSPMLYPLGYPHSISIHVEV